MARICGFYAYRNQGCQLGLTYLWLFPSHVRRPGLAILIFVSIEVFRLWSTACTGRKKRSQKKESQKKECEKRKNVRNHEDNSKAEKTWQKSGRFGSSLWGTNYSTPFTFSVI